MRAWESFVDGNIASVELEKTVRPEILASWARCSTSGVSALASSSPRRVDENHINTLRRKNRHLCEAASAAFDRLAPHLCGTGAILILTDPEGTIIDVIGDAQTLDLGREIHLEVGGAWDEQVIGTNGIGTALRTGKPTYVHASEHFCQGIKSWTCVGVPIIDALDRSVIGVIDLSGPSSIHQPHNVALVVSTAREIELHLAHRQREEHTTLLEEFIGNPRRHDSSSVIVLLNSSGKVVFSRNTEQLELDGFGRFDAGTQLLDLYPDMSVRELEAALPPALPTKDIDLIKAGGETQGVALIFHNQSASLPPRFSSAGISIKPRSGVQEDEVNIVGECPKMQEAIEFAYRAAEMKVPVLIQGETGVGKEMFARLIHSHLANRTTPYVVVNCATLSSELIRNELFGHVVEAHPGFSREDKLGKFERANGGVLCLDEVGDMPIELQTFLLRTLEQRAIYRVGCDIRRPIDVQHIAMTSRNIREDIINGRFRQDLFYRIGTIVIEIPPLRERGQDLDRLIDYFNEKLSRKFGREKLRFDAATISALHQYRWPGNVRELRNIIERLCLLNHKSIVSASDLPEEIANPNSNAFLSGNEPSMSLNNPMDLDELESIAIQRTIDREKGNLSKVATALGISRPTLYRKIKGYGLNRNK
ncbi:sigma-54-dependent Fis family transcriptional regulator [Granulosicoccus antarcticus]|uniref:Acetoin dehydrogenase operon transcriptional activator AcoR n=1 Tax=Granulosicoccus antarcticus IMCC3135 TaxID=1192854 RepID=A0A2Z2NTI8_9GAMM|nr:sigma-54-dependent Fis family transcriptional regulator [Granulosicoccus antarcticus]ASJ74862.1 Acetoin dehydrogenase operon transcriptional activator AcoR [Granulosicoccus antarcticus IMCC3135]